MDAEWAGYGPQARQACTAFTRGINAYIDHCGRRLPIEFQLLGLQPKKWQPEDCLGRMSGIIMTRNFRDEVGRAELIAAVGLAKARQFAPTDPVRDFAPAPELALAGIDRAVLAGYEASTKAVALAEKLYDHSYDLFNRIRDLVPRRHRNGDQISFLQRIAWNFKKTKVDVLVGELESVNGDAMESFSGQSVVKNELVLFYERGR